MAAEVTVTSAIDGYQVTVGPYESREQAERMASLVRFAIVEDRTEKDARRTDVDRALDASGDY